ncbi:hypothetical protein H072_8806 [Dactylellina haptotyla CBS 200.50]|uniref:REJ domain-containing protein n=1 Tax=Dactylellina haptotyla (strain CBS 200.50) TaxID=1284197 RepID=S8A8T3_DACHA|nr:hypothetical protein H072_8806 [Dactylellina haptotyla CBS 200.50]
MKFTTVAALSVLALGASAQTSSSFSSSALSSSTVSSLSMSSTGLPHNTTSVKNGTLATTGSPKPNSANSMVSVGSASAIGLFCLVLAAF